MSSPCDEIEIRCPDCGNEFKSWTRRSLNLRLDHFDDEYIREVTVKKCPGCGTEIHLGCLVVGMDGVWRQF